MKDIVFGRNNGSMEFKRHIPNGTGTANDDEHFLKHPNRWVILTGMIWEHGLMLCETSERSYNRKNPKTMSIWTKHQHGNDQLKALVYCTWFTLMGNRYDKKHENQMSQVL